jgi:hypothetical protein
MKNRIIDNVANILLITLRETQHSIRVSFWRAEQALTRRIFSNAFENRANRAGDLCKTIRGLFWGLFETLTGSATWL